jgi:hypothetical protein
MILAHYYLDDLEHKETSAPLSHNRTGYGKKIPTVYMVKLPGSNRWRRVYCCQYSNIGTSYVATPKGWFTIGR